MKYKFGDEVIIIERLNGHQFQPGTKVKVVDIITDSETPHYIVRDEHGKDWAVDDREVKKFYELIA